ncbi:MAG: YkoF family thiamine/hydroxymethylpyrimidine-binding protein [Cellvibrionaceae bacterium]
MQLSVELTLYPLQDNYLDIIRDTVAKIHSYSDLKVNTFPTATIIIGEYDQVMDLVKEVVAWSYQTHGKCVFVAKFLPDYVAD